VQAAQPMLTVTLQILRDLLFVNLALMAFNLFPVAPLDGSSVLRLFIPVWLEDRYDDFLRIGPFVLLGLILLESFLPVRILSVWVFSIIEFVLRLFGDGGRDLG
jgi:Zn-dependent protease